MKKKIIILCTIVLTLAFALTLSACVQFEEPFEAPEGFSWWTNNQIAFLLSDSWNEATPIAGVDVQFGTGLPNFNIVSGRRSTELDDIDLEEYRRSIEAGLPGAVVSNVQRESVVYNEVEMTRISLTTTLMGTSMAQEQYIIQARRRTIAITFTMSPGTSRCFINEVIDNLIVI